MTTINMQVPAEREYFAVCQLKGQLKILSHGMSIRGLSKTKALARAAELTGKKKYSSKRIGDAIADLEAKRDELLAEVAKVG